MDSINVGGSKSNHSAGSGGLQISQLFPEPMPGGMQPPLDRPDRAREVIAHLLQRLPVEVEGDQGIPIEIPQPTNPFPQLSSLLAGDQTFPRFSGIVLAEGVEHLWFLGDFRRPPDGVVDRQPDRDPMQPADEPNRFPQLIDLPHGPQEHFLSHFGRFSAVPQPLHHDGVNRRFELGHQLAERIPRTCLSSSNQLN